MAVFRGFVFFVVAALGLSACPARAAGTLDFGTINAMDRAGFVETFGGIFEKSPWVAEKVWDKRPFADAGHLHAAMVSVVKKAPLPAQLALLQAHPDLAGKEAQSGAMTASSVAEQSSVGLNALTKPELAWIAEMNASYRRKFGFPFIIAVRMHTKEGIFFDFKQRLKNDTQTEYANGLQNVYAITRLRLQTLLGPD